MTTETLAERLGKCVKPLEWKHYEPDNTYPEAWCADCCGGFYTVLRDSENSHRWITPNGVEHDDDLDFAADAQAAAQADYTTRILAALDMDAIARLVEEAVEEDRAEFHCQDCDLPSYLCEARCSVRNAIKVHGEEKTWESIKEYFPAIRASLVAEAVEMEREAIAAFIESHAYCTNGGDTCLEPSRFPGMDRHHATIAAAIRARADRQTEGE